MSIDVVVKQKGLFKSRIPLSVILGDSLAFGSFDGVQLDTGKVHGDTVICYDPAHIARGFSVQYPEEDRGQVVLRALTPTGPHELRAFYDCVRRIAKFCRCSIEVDGEKTKLGDFLSTYDKMLEFNLTVLRHFSDNANETSGNGFTLLCAMFPLSLGREEMEKFSRAESLDEFERYLHEKQSLDIYYANPRMFRIDGDVVGRYVLTEDVRSVFPLAPRVPFGMTDPDSGEALKADGWKIAFYSITEDRAVGELDYDRFIELLPRDKYTRFDAENILIEGLSLDDIRAILEN